jgi:DNA-binding transcriptional regulator YiaG
VATKDPNPTGEEIRRVRESMGLTLVEFGRHVGLPWQSLQAYEAGRAEPPAKRLFLILHATRRAPEPFRVMHVARALAA